MVDNEKEHLQSNEYKSADKPPIALHAIRIPVTMLEAMTPTLYYIKVLASRSFTVISIHTKIWYRSLTMTCVSCFRIGDSGDRSPLKKRLIRTHCLQYPIQVLQWLAIRLVCIRIACYFFLSSLYHTKNTF